MTQSHRTVVSIIIPPDPIWEVSAREEGGETSYSKIQLLMYVHHLTFERELQRHFSRNLPPYVEVFYSTSLFVNVSSWTSPDKHFSDRKGRCSCGGKTCRIVGILQGKRFSPDDPTWEKAEARAQLLNYEAERREATSAKAKARRNEKKAAKKSSD